MNSMALIDNHGLAKEAKALSDDSPEKEEGIELGAIQTTWQLALSKRKALPIGAYGSFYLRSFELLLSNEKG